MLDSAAALMSKVSKNCAISRLHGSARKIVAIKKKLADFAVLYFVMFHWTT